MVNSIALGLFLVTAAVGAAMARRARQGQPLRATVLLVHGTFAMAGILTLILSVAPKYGTHDTGLPGMALGLLLLGAGLGVSMFRTHEPGERLKLQPLIAHAALALAGIALLGVSVAGLGH